MTDGIIEMASGRHNEKEDEPNQKRHMENQLCL
jgi:hypothetical protein